LKGLSLFKTYFSPFSLEAKGRERKGVGGWQTTKSIQLLCIVKAGVKYQVPELAPDISAK